MEMQSLQDLFVMELRDLLNAENQILKTLPKMAKAAQSSQLQQAFQQHMQQTEGQIDRLEQIFDQIGVPAKSHKCKGIAGIIDEGKEMMKDADEDTMDATLIGAAQKVEHYEIASYGTVRTFAQLLGNEEAAQLLQQTLDEEKQTDVKLTKLAESGINQEANEGGSSTGSKSGAGRRTGA